MYTSSRVRPLFALLVLSVLGPVASGGQAKDLRVTYYLSGAIGSLPVRMQLVRNGRELSGSYVYEAKTGLHSVVTALSLSGTVDAKGRFTLQETTLDSKYNDVKTGALKGTLTVEAGAAKVTGTWSKPDGSGALPAALAALRVGPDGSRIVTKERTEPDARFKRIVSASYPAFEGSSNAKIAALNAAVVQQVARIVEDFKTNLDDFDDETAERLSLEITTEVTVATPDVVSLLFSVYTDFGGAHPSGYAETLTFDMRAAKPMALADLFADKRTYAGTLSAKVRPVLESREELSMASTPEGDDYGVWYLTPNGLTLVFSVPHVVGDTAEVFLPYRELRPSLDPAGPVGGLLK